MSKNEIEIRECVTPEELSDCVRLQRKVFALPDIEISPVRHLIVTRHSGGFTLGAFSNEKLVGFVLSVRGFLEVRDIFYSHMTAIDPEFQNYGIGGKLKWAQREKALEEGVKFIKWTFQPVMARNAYFNLEKLGAIVRHYEPDFYGTDYAVFPESGGDIGIPSDRLFAEWHLESEKVVNLSEEKKIEDAEAHSAEIEIPNDWNALVKEDFSKALETQERIKEEFEKAFAEGLICRRFHRDSHHPKYLLYNS